MNYRKPFDRIQQTHSNILNIITIIVIHPITNNQDDNTHLSFVTHWCNHILAVWLKRRPTTQTSCHPVFPVGVHWDNSDQRLRNYLFHGDITGPWYQQLARLVLISCCFLYLCLKTVFIFQLFLAANGLSRINQRGDCSRVWVLGPQESNHLRCNVWSVLGWG